MLISLARASKSALGCVFIQHGCPGQDVVYESFSTGYQVFEHGPPVEEPLGGAFLEGHGHLQGSDAYRELYGFRVAMSGQVYPTLLLFFGYHPEFLEVFDGTGEGLPLSCRVIQGLPHFFFWLPSLFQKLNYLHDESLPRIRYHDIFRIGHGVSRILWSGHRPSFAVSFSSSNGFACLLGDVDFQRSRTPRCGSDGS